jgi:hypothetical protein
MVYYRLKIYMFSSRCLLPLFFYVIIGGYSTLLRTMANVLLNTAEDRTIWTVSNWFDVSYCWGYYYYYYYYYYHHHHHHHHHHHLRFEAFTATECNKVFSDNKPCENGVVIQRHSYTADHPKRLYCIIIIIITIIIIIIIWVKTRLCLCCME